MIELLDDAGAFAESVAFGEESHVAESEDAVRRGARDRIGRGLNLANPTSNRIYGDIGYRRLADFEEHALGR
ncbi:MAG TPA: hypothetical protein VKV21_04585 [Solirubrobacteraceae bacterium]|nr:hypothetical protein [Solirubrobacteraceae bacterium]